MLKTFLTVMSCATVLSCSGQRGTEKEDNKPVVENLSDEALMDKVQKESIKYFWDYAEPNSYLARERYYEGDASTQNDAHVVTTGGSGFGLASILVGVERGFISRQEAVSRLDKMMDFLACADRFKGAWSHWIDGRTGKVIPFSQKDNGGDLVETSFLASGMIMVREYFKNGNAQEQALAKKCDDLWKGIEWDWYTKGGEKQLYWHWSPNYQWDMNLPITGYNECLITYVLAASSPTHAIDADTYYQGWTRHGAYLSSQTQYGLPLYVKHSGSEQYGGPLFWAHYSYLGLDPTGLSDKQIPNYFELNKNHVLIDYKYCLENPKHWRGYSQYYWGLTASYTRKEDGTTGYSAHHPKNDKGVITPTAALSSFPYTPNESMAYLRFLYTKTPQFVGSSGPYDANSIHYNWFTPRYLAIDQGTIAPMIENHRTGFLWKLFMNAPEVKQGLKKLEFHSSKYGI